MNKDFGQGAYEKGWNRLAEKRLLEDSEKIAEKSLEEAYVQQSKSQKQMSTDEQLAKPLSLGLVGGCLVCIVVPRVPLSIAALLAPVTGVSVEDLLMLVLAKLWFG